MAAGADTGTSAKRTFIEELGPELLAEVPASRSQVNPLKPDIRAERGMGSRSRLCED